MAEPLFAFPNRFLHAFPLGDVTNHPRIFLREADLHLADGDVDVDLSAVLSHGQHIAPLADNFPFPGDQIIREVFGVVLAVRGRHDDGNVLSDEFMRLIAQQF